MQRVTSRTSAQIIHLPSCLLDETREPGKYIYIYESNPSSSGLNQAFQSCRGGNTTFCAKVPPHMQMNYEDHLRILGFDKDQNDIVVYLKYFFSVLCVCTAAERGNVHFQGGVYHLRVFTRALVLVLQYACEERRFEACTELEGLYREM